MSDFKLHKIGTYTQTVSKSTNKPMIKISLDPQLLVRIKEWDLDKIYIYEPRTAGDILGLYKEDDKSRGNNPNQKS